MKTMASVRRLPTLLMKTSISVAGYRVNFAAPAFDELISGIDS